MAKKDIKLVKNITQDTTIRVAIKKLGDLALKILLLCSYLNADTIPLSLLESYVEQVDSKHQTKSLSLLKPALEELESRSLIHLGTNKTKTISIHRLVQKIVLHHHKELASQTYSEYIRLFNTQLENKNNVIILMPHILQFISLLNHQQLSTAMLFSFGVYQLLNYIAAYQWSKGDYETANQFFEQVYHILEDRYGKNHIQVASALNNLANAKGALGDIVKEKEMFERALEIQEGFYGKGHIELVGTLNNLGNAITGSGDPAKGKERIEEALNIQERHYGKDDIKLVDTLNNLGNTITLLGDPATAKKHIERAFVILERHYGKNTNNIALAGTLYNLAVCSATLKDHIDCCKYAQRAYSIWKQNYGDDSKYTISSLKLFQECSKVIPSLVLPSYALRSPLEPELKFSGYFIQFMKQHKLGVNNLNDTMRFKRGTKINQIN